MIAATYATKAFLTNTAVESSAEDTPHPSAEKIVHPINLPPQSLHPAAQVGPLGPREGDEAHQPPAEQDAQCVPFLRPAAPPRWPGELPCNEKITALSYGEQFSCGGGGLARDILEELD